MKCPVCSDEFTPKRSDAKTCGKSACQKKMQRDTKKGIQSTGVITHQNIIDAAKALNAAPIPKYDRVGIDITTGAIFEGVKHTPTDRLFEEKKDNYFIYEDKSFDRKCAICKKDFQTRAKFRKFCSPNCEDQIWTLIAGIEPTVAKQKA